MKMNKYLTALLGISAIILSSCEDNFINDGDVEKIYSAHKLPIIGGTAAGENEYPAAVSLFVDIAGTKSSMCTGTLIAPNYVLTAGHCVSSCEGDGENPTEAYRPFMRIGIGAHEGHYQHEYDIAKIITHSGYVCTDTLIKNDIALIKLSGRVPSSVAEPVPPLPPDLEIRAQEVDKGNVGVTHVGFGMTDFQDRNSGGRKYKAENVIRAICPLRGNQSSDCYYNGLTEGFVYFHYSSLGVSLCSGDSGGPTFISRRGRTYVMGVSSWVSGECSSWSAVTNVSEYYDGFIRKYAGDVVHAEDCFNHKDDNGDGLIDCMDPYCRVQCTPEDCGNDTDDNDDGKTDCEDPQCADAQICLPEDCGNGLDDNGDGKIDCEDRQCRRMLRCQPENCTNGVDDNGDYLVDCYDPECGSNPECRPEDCTNGVDDNGNGYIDCNDPECFVQAVCRPEDCTNGVDDNGNGKIDCEDAQCVGKRACQPEDCTNGMDDNGNGLTDCADPSCANLQICIPEICNDFVDNNGNGLVDCADPSCRTSVYCRPEDCTNGADDNGNGKIDCEDPSCGGNIACAVEICDDGIDNDGNGRADCADDACGDSSACRSSSCSASPMTGHAPSGALLLGIAGLLGMAFRRRGDGM